MKVSEEKNYLEALKDKDLEIKEKVSIIGDLKEDKESLIQYIDLFKESRDKWITLGWKLTEENESLKHELEMARNTVSSLHEDEKVITSKLQSTEERFLRLSAHFDVLQYENRVLKKENKQLKNRKFWQI